MAYTGDAPTLGELMLSAAERVVDSLWVAVPVQVISFDPATGCADVSPVVREIDEDGHAQGIPRLRSVPVLWPAGGGSGVVWSLEQGDIGVILCASRSIAQWVISGESLALPEGRRRSSLADAMLLPLRLSPMSSPAPGVDGTLSSGEVRITSGDIRLGSGSAIDPVALSSLVSGELTAISAAFATVASALAIPNPYPAPGLVGASKVRGE